MKKLPVTRYPLPVTRYNLMVLRSYGLMVFLFFCLLPSVAFAQKNTNSKTNSENKKVFFGVSVGPTIDWFTSTSKDLSRYKLKGGMIAGINVEVNLPKTKMFYFSTGLLVRYLQGDFSYQKEYDFSGPNPINNTIRVSTVTTYQTTYLTIPTGIKFRMPIKNCAFIGKLGLYHNFRIGGKQFDSFTLPNDNAIPNKYFVSTPKIKNTAAALFAESGFLGLGFEYTLKNNFRIFTNMDYSCQFNYFSTKAKNNITNKQFKSIIHSLHIVVGVLF